MDLKRILEELLFFREEMKNSWKRCVIGTLPRSFQDLNQGSLLKMRGFAFNLNQDPIQDAA